MRSKILGIIVSSAEIIIYGAGVFLDNLYLRAIGVAILIGTTSYLLLGFNKKRG